MRQLNFDSHLELIVSGEYQYFKMLAVANGTTTVSFFMPPNMMCHVTSNNRIFVRANTQMQIDIIAWMLDWTSFYIHHETEIPFQITQTLLRVKILKYFTEPVTVQHLAIDSNYRARIEATWKFPQVWNTLRNEYDSD